jgi:hypothetical protein
VPPNWQHPRYTEGNAKRRDWVGNYMPMYDQEYESAAEEWLDSCLKWSNVEHPDQQEYESASQYKYFWEWEGGPPDADYYRPKFTEEPTWYQCYENVSEGTPVSPPFATQAELVDWLVANGDPVFGAISKEAAERFVQSQYAPSMVVTDGQIQGGIQALSR